MDHLAPVRLFRVSLFACAGLTLAAGALACSSSASGGADAARALDAATDSPRSADAAGKDAASDAGERDDGVADASMMDVGARDAGNPCSPPVNLGLCAYTWVPLSRFPGEVSPDAAAPGAVVCTRLCPTSSSTEGSYCYVRRLVDGGPPGLDCVSDTCNP